MDKKENAHHDEARQASNKSNPSNDSIQNGTGLQDIELPAGHAWMPNDECEAARDLFNLAILGIITDAVTDVCVESPTGAPHDNCAVVTATIGGTRYRFHFVGWKPTCRVDASSWHADVQAMLDAFCPVDAVASDLKTHRGASALIADREVARAELLAADEKHASKAWALQRFLSDPANWADLIPASAALGCVIPAHWIKGGVE